MRPKRGKKNVTFFPSWNSSIQLKGWGQRWLWSDSAALIWTIRFQVVAALRPCGPVSSAPHIIKSSSLILHTQGAGATTCVSCLAKNHVRQHQLTKDEGFSHFSCCGNVIKATCGCFLSRKGKFKLTSPLLRLVEVDINAFCLKKECCSWGKCLRKHPFFLKRLSLCTYFVKNKK